MRVIVQVPGADEIGIMYRIARRIELQSCALLLFLHYHIPDLAVEGVPFICQVCSVLGLMCLSGENYIFTVRVTLILDLVLR